MNLSYLFILCTKDGSETFSLRELPIKFRQAAAKLPIGGRLDLPTRNYLISIDAGKEPLVQRLDARVLACASPEAGTVGTGGMLSKLQAAKKCAASGIPMIIAPGKERELLLRLLAGEDLGTFFVPRQRAYHGRKVWLAHLPKPAGDLILDAGAMVAMEKGGKSLLPIGIREVWGTFGVGAAVRCLAEDGHTIGIGLSNYKSGEIDRIKGHRSEGIETLIGYKHSDEVIHRNNFVLAGEHLAAETE